MYGIYRELSSVRTLMLEVMIYSKVINYKNQSLCNFALRFLSQCWKVDPPIFVNRLANLLLEKILKIKRINHARIYYNSDVLFYSLPFAIGKLYMLSKDSGDASIFDDEEDTVTRSFLVIEINYTQQFNKSSQLRNFLRMQSPFLSSSSASSIVSVLVHQCLALVRISCGDASL
ncbi:hypothetical protein G4B88_029070 [Cannabis sativa]|uniref:Uncharacterized protein n=1 Tax=Cannabis sativa TaxID=3483 RepID=A0A7J6DSM3_CANSA|nr:hypothetical protein G4B88_029070 [Cannabis sativa]